MFTLTGVLVDHGGEPIPNQKVEITPNPGRTVDVDNSKTRLGEPKNVFTGHDGRFAISLEYAPGLWYRVVLTRVTNQGRSSYTLEFEAPEEEGETVDISDPSYFSTPAPSPMTSYVRGASAYEVWLEEGNTGTVEDFLAGTTDHRDLTQRDAADQHPISAVTGLQDALDGKVDGDDPRLSDARTPTDHRHAWGDLDDVPSIPTAPGDIGAQPAGDYAAADHDHDGVYVKPSDLPAPPDLSDVVREDDPRLSDAREPTAHSHPEYLTSDDVPEFPDLSAFVETDDSRLSDARTPLDHRHPWSDLDDTPDIPASPEDIGAQPAGDYLTHGDLPEAPDLSDVIREGDERLSDARPPISHRHDYADLDGTPVIPSQPGDIGAQPAGDYATRDEIPNQRLDDLESRIAALEEPSV